MDFFENQEVARKKTGRLVFLFVLAVIAIVISVYFVIAAATIGLARGEAGSLLANPLLIAAVGVGTILVIGLGSLYKMAQLRAGGRFVAESLGGRLLRSESTDATERKVLNVVEEMAIASGTPCPPVYFMDKETGINAFAAGRSPDDAVIGITRGCAEQLSRDELQGVIAHEFSHILNGDMRLNIRLIGVLHGILVIGIIGYFVLRATAYSSMGRRSSRDKGGGMAAILLIGAGLAIIGFMGTFFGNWIKAAVSRQREYLADSSAVQFTRNPSGIADALKRIGGAQNGSTIASPNAPQSSHMFFGRAVTSGLNSMFSTHPPLPKRILRIDPGWDGTFLAPRPSRRSVEKKADRKQEQQRRARALEMIAVGAAGAAGAAATGVGAIGQPTTQHIEYARELIASLPPTLADAAREAYSARAVIYALLIDADESIRRAQMDILSQRADRGVPELVAQLLPSMTQLRIEARLPLIERAIGSLRELSAPQYKQFKAIVDELVNADNRLGLLEWTLQRIVVHHLDPYFEGARPSRVRFYGWATLKTECETLLSLLAYAGHRTKDEAKQAFDAAVPRLGLPGMSIRSIEQCGLGIVDEALDTLTAVAPRLKRQLVEACAACISADQEITVNEAEIMRAICDAMECPMPPLLPGQKLI